MKERNKWRKTSIWQEWKKKKKELISVWETLTKGLLSNSRICTQAEMGMFKLFLNQEIVLKIACRKTILTCMLVIIKRLRRSNQYRKYLLHINNHLPINNINNLQSNHIFHPHLHINHIFHPLKIPSALNNNTVSSLTHINNQMTDHLLKVKTKTKLIKTFHKMI